MFPIDPAETTKKQNQSPMAPPYVDEDIEMELTEQGMQVAEDEKRDSITSGYEADATESSEPEEHLDDISYPQGNPGTLSPELSAMKEERPPASE